MGNEVTKAKIVSSLLWSLLQRSGVQGIQLLITLILARLLLPEDFGLIVIVTIFNTFAIVIVQSGFTTALIQKKKVDHVDLSSVFYVNIISSSIIYMLLFYLAPTIAFFFEQQQLILILRVLSLSLFLSAFHSIQYVIVSRNMQFKDLFLASSIAHALSGMIAVGMAYADFGVWALVFQQLASHLITPFLLSFKVEWRPQLFFSMRNVMQLFSFGWKILVSSLLNAIYSNMHSVIIGKLFSPAMIGYYNKADQFPNIIVSNVNGSIQAVMLPALSSYQDNRQRVKEMVRRTIVTSSYVVFPMMIGLAMIAEPLVRLLLTDKWLPTVPFLQIFCMVYALYPIQTANLQAINALGRSDVFLKLEVLKTLLGLGILIISIQFGLYVMVFGVFISSVLFTIIDAYPNKQLLNYGMLEQLRDVFPSLLIALAMGGLLFLTHGLEFSMLTTVFIQIILGSIIYVVLSRIFKLECYEYLRSTLLSILGSSTKKYNLTFYNKEDNKEI
ncbi:lipopolysaccharide biosynthesis protein [Solibacillus daqui]|uniref:lipopolysaccharide biosynthesis protein n=1 Tax=Solibacillus daqui TaxID=2912187 RepID=UPI002366D2AD|nr:lipopolysaccharide biosynthesis protein [Solibacillus daqui]